MLLDEVLLYITFYNLPELIFIFHQPCYPSNMMLLYVNIHFNKYYFYLIGVVVDLRIHKYRVRMETTRLTCVCQLLLIHKRTDGQPCSQ